MSKQYVWTACREAGCWTFRCEGRFYRISKGSDGWEISIKDNDVGGYVLSSGQTPEGVFRTLRTARRTLQAFVDANPVPKLTVSQP